MKRVMYDRQMYGNIIYYQHQLKYRKIDLPWICHINYTFPIPVIYLPKQVLKAPLKIYYFTIRVFYSDFWKHLAYIENNIMLTIAICAI